MSFFKIFLALALLLAFVSQAQGQAGCFMACTKDKRCSKYKGAVKKECKFSCTCSCYQNLLSKKQKKKCTKLYNSGKWL